jgi:hypothetical protein
MFERLEWTQTVMADGDYYGVDGSVESALLLLLSTARIVMMPTRIREIGRHERNS